MYTVFGHVGSPYSMKMRAVMRYRRIPHIWRDGAEGIMGAREKVKVPVIPVFRYPDGSYHNDSTPLIYDLEKRHLNGRSILPERESDAFLAYLIEDMADELLAKPMYHFRWFDDRYTRQISEWIAFDMFAGGGRENIETFAKDFRERQRSRLAFVGSSESNRPLLEHISDLFLDALESHVVNRMFLFGTRPSMAEFGLFGQLSQYHNDLAIIDHARRRAPFSFRWILQMHDQSGIDGSWRSDDEELPDIIETLLKIAGEYYFPFLNANAAASAAGDKEFSFEVGGMSYSQGVFGYQIKCLKNLKAAYAGLSEQAKSELQEMLEKTGSLSPLLAP